MHMKNKFYMTTQVVNYNIYKLRIYKDNGYRLGAIESSMTDLTLQMKNIVSSNEQAAEGMLYSSA